MRRACPGHSVQRPPVLKHFLIHFHCHGRPDHDKSIQGKQDLSPLWHLEMPWVPRLSKKWLIRHIQECFQGVRAMQGTFNISSYLPLLTFTAHLFKIGLNCWATPITYALLPPQNDAYNSRIHADV